MGKRGQAIRKIGSLLTSTVLTALMACSATAEACRDDGLPEARPITESELAQIRAAYAPLAGQWMALPKGEAMELTFALEPSA